MADSKVDICNSALTKLGAPRITSITQDTPAARHCNAQFDNIRKEVLRAHWWNFAIARVELAQVSGTTPAYGFDYYYQLPSDCLRVLSEENDKYVGSNTWRVEGSRRIASSLSTMKIKYIQNVTDVAQFDPVFDEAMAYRLAADLAYPLLQDRVMMTDMMQLYRQQLAHARFLDATEGTPEYDDYSEIISVRN